MQKQCIYDVLVEYRGTVNVWADHNAISNAIQMQLRSLNRDKD
jgi:hypothetical protein